MARIGRFVVFVACALYCQQNVTAVYDFTSPILNEQIFDNANVLTKGHRNMGETVYVKLIEGGMHTGGNSGTIAAGPQQTDWEYNFPCPQELWTVSNNWVAHLYDADTDNEVAAPGRAYKIIAH
jgi:hypothetical protein